MHDADLMDAVALCVGGERGGGQRQPGAERKQAEHRRLASYAAHAWRHGITPLAPRILAPARFPAAARRSASRVSAGWRRAPARHTSATGRAGTRAGSVTTRPAGASASANAGTSP